MTATERTAIVTGAASGLGRASALALAERGMAVVAAGLEPDGLEETARMIHERGGRAIAVETDISDPAAIERLAARTADELGGTDVLVNNAAIFPLRAWHEIDAEEWDRVFAVNVRGYFLCSRAVLRQMLERGGGAIVNVSSVTFFLGFRGFVHYVSSKGAVTGLTRALAREVGPDGIRVNAVAPGAFPTRAEEIHPDREAMNRMFLEQQSLKRRGRSEDIGAAVAFLASDAASFITGQTLLVDGGWYMH
jgi:3-oxoacyl-[acyl-carrier protein] reductase